MAFGRSWGQRISVTRATFSDGFNLWNLPVKLCDPSLAKCVKNGRSAYLVARHIINYQQDYSDQKVFTEINHEKMRKQCSHCHHCLSTDITTMSWHSRSPSQASAPGSSRSPLPDQPPLLCGQAACQSIVFQSAGQSSRLPIRTAHPPTGWSHPPIFLKSPCPSSPNNSFVKHQH